MTRTTTNWQRGSFSLFSSHFLKITRRRRDFLFLSPSQGGNNPQVDRTSPIDSSSALQKNNRNVPPQQQFRLSTGTRVAFSFVNVVEKIHERKEMRLKLVEDLLWNIKIVSVG
jgi:hypothetical protein